MDIMLGNLELQDIVKPEYIDQVQSFFDNNGFQREQKCDQVCMKPGNYHIYYMPRTLVICDMAKVEQFVSFVKQAGISAIAFIGSIQVSCETCIIEAQAKADAYNKADWNRIVDKSAIRAIEEG